MKTLFPIIIACLLFVCHAHSGAAQAGFYIPPHRKQIDIPFEYTNNFIILTLNFNKIFPLKFIFDTGAEHTILTKREISDLMRVTYEREFRVTGSDLKTILIAYLARRIQFEIPERLLAPQEDILVLEDDYFRFEEYAGVDVHGILSANSFSKYIFKINYQKRVITLFTRESFKGKEEGYVELPIEIYRNKPYIKTNLHMVQDSVAPVKLLLDTGAGLPLLLFSNTHPLVHPPANALQSNIGMGLGGYLEGFIGRIPQLDLGVFSQNGIVTYFQQLDSVQDPKQYNSRNGLIGNVLLDRFQIVFDYYNEKIWLKPTKYYKNEFVYDRSGITVIAAGSRLNNFTVQNVLPGSPADRAGIRRGDQIIKVGHLPTLFHSLSSIQDVLQGKAGKKVRLTFKREGEKFRKQIVLEDLL